MQFSCRSSCSTVVTDAMCFVDHSALTGSASGWSATTATRRWARAARAPAATVTASTPGSSAAASWTPMASRWTVCTLLVDSPSEFDPGARGDWYTRPLKYHIRVHEAHIYCKCYTRVAARGACTVASGDHGEGFECPAGQQVRARVLIPLQQSILSQDFKANLIDSCASSCTVV